MGIEPTLGKQVVWLWVLNTSNEGVTPMFKLSTAGTRNYIRHSQGLGLLLIIEGLQVPGGGGPVRVNGDGALHCQRVAAVTCF